MGTEKDGYNERAGVGSGRGTITKCSLALAYYPEARSRKAATNRLLRWMNYCRPLMAELAKTGYTPRQKTFTPRQAALVEEYLGEP